MRSDGTKLLPCLNHDTQPTLSTLQTPLPYGYPTSRNSLISTVVYLFSSYLLAPSTSLLSLPFSLPPSVPSVQPISASISPINPSSSSAHQSPPLVHPSFYPPSSLPQSYCPSCSCCANVQPLLLSLCQCHRLQTLKVGWHYTCHQNFPFQFYSYCCGPGGRVRRPLGGRSYVDSHQTPRNCRPSHTDNSVTRRVA